MITQERLKELFSYNADTGHLTRKVARGPATGGVRAGCINTTTGYRQIKIDYRLYQEHRLVWLFIHGSFPPDCLDHINGVKDDNRFDNLREATYSENNMNQGLQSNNTSGFKGVDYLKSSGKYRARISINRTTKALGYYTTREEAHKAYCKASLEYHQEFSRIN
jgi:hypothetical protein